MVRNKPPSFDFFPDDFIAGTYHLEAEAVGIYVRLLCYQWSNGSIPNNLEDLSKIAGVSTDAMRTHMRTVMRKFSEVNDGELVNDRLEKERQHKLGVIEKAKASADKRWANKKAEKPSSAVKDDGCGRNADGYADAMLPTSNFLLPTSNVLEVDKSTSCPEVSKDTSEPKSEFSFVTVDGSLWSPTVAKVQEWKGTYPLMDVDDQLRRARQWCSDNPTYRKTQKGMTRFLSSWLSRAQDSRKFTPIQPQKKNSEFEKAKVYE